MSLIKCPECNKDVSDHADMCSNCGFNISEYIKEIKYEEEKNKRINEIIKTIEIPKKPKKLKPINENFYTTLNIIAGILLFFSICICFYISQDLIQNYSFSLMVLLGISSITSLCIFVFGSHDKDEKKQELKEYEIQLKQYNNYIENPEEYKIKIAKQQYDKEEVSRLIQNKRIEQQTIPKCPTCQSIDIRKISATSKVVNTAMFGVAGTKRHKTFHCNNCGYEW